MFKSDHIIYIQMQKTGCTHIASLLSSLFNGEQIGKHNAAPADDITQKDRFFLSSIRNPWDWYLSLWTYGIQGSGGLRNRLTTRNLTRSLSQTMKNPTENYRSLFDELTKDVKLWDNLYSDSNDINSFRKWLKHIHEPSNSRYLGEGYGNTKIYSFCGFMTYRYLYLCCQNIDLLKKSKTVSNFQDLVQFDQANCYIDFFVRQESLESDFCEAIEKIRSLSDEERALIYEAKKTNTSKRKLLISDYYDDETIDLILTRDALLIEKFGYTPPTSIV